jgi:ketosteroid isomerase-like protein
MKAMFQPRSECSHRFLAAGLSLAVLLFVVLGGLAGACSGTQTTTAVSGGAPSTQALTTTTQAVTTTEAVTTTTRAVTVTTVALVPMSAAEITRWKTGAVAFGDRFYGAWPDVDASFAQFADDATFYDPIDGDFTIEGKQAIVTLEQGLFQYFPDIKVHQKAAYLSASGAAYATATENLWPPGVPEPADHPEITGLELFRFRDGLVASWEIWASPASLEMVSMGCFAPGKGGSQQLRTIADRYLAAWSSGDKDRIAALYRKDAVFSDSILGVQAQGAGAISELGDKRFGSASKTAFEAIDLYVQTNGPDPPTVQLPEQGAIIAVGIHYRSNMLVDGAAKTVEGLTTFELGTRRGSTFVPDPNNLITREETFYDADSLPASGLVG